MNKRQFLRELERHLDQLPKEEIYEHTRYYSELIDDMTEDGMTEEEAVRRMGDPAGIAMQILQNASLHTLVKSRVRPKKGWTALTIILLIIGCPVWIPVLIALVAVALAVFICIWAVIAAVFACVIGVVVAGVGLFIVSFGNGALPTLLAVGIALVLLGLAVLAFLGAVYTAKLLIKAAAAFGRWIKSLFIRK